MSPQTGLDIEDPIALVAYLRTRAYLQAGEEPAVRVLRGGVSNRTVLVERSGGEAWVLKQSLPKLRVAVDWFSAPERIHQEALGLQWLEKLLPPGSVPGFIFEDRGYNLLVMQAVPQPHENWKTMLLAGGLDREHIRQFAGLAAALHSNGWKLRAELEPVFGDTSFFETLRLEPYYEYASSQVPAARDFLRMLIADTRARRDTLVHGDYSPKNVLVHRGRLVLLDHEVIHAGDPSFDLGFSMTHLLSKAHHLPAYRREFADACDEYWRAYVGALGDVPWKEGLEQRAVRQTLGCLLARVAGRSPLEYLNDDERRRQREVVLRLMKSPPDRVRDLIGGFAEGIEQWQ